jgi:hypothetical protein
MAISAEQVGPAGMAVTTRHQEQREELRFLLQTVEEMAQIQKAVMAGLEEQAAMEEMEE